MKNKNSKVKKANFIKKFLIIVSVQVLILLLFLACFGESRPIDPKNAVQVRVQVTDVAYERVVSEYRFSIYSHSDEYVFSNMGSFSKYSNRELYETIQIGDELSITYVEENGLFGKTHWVIDARTETETYRSMDEYNAQSEKAHIGIIVLFCIIEFFYLTGLTLYVLFNKKQIKRHIKMFFKKNRKGQSRGEDSV